MTTPIADLPPRAPLGEPISRFQDLLAAAKAVGSAVLPEPTAFSLGTVGSDGQPSVRIVLLKSVDTRGFVLFTNYDSQKGLELLTNPRAAMCFHWQPLQRQVRVEGSARPVTPDEADAYFASRKRGSQLGAWASRQSQLMEPGELAERLDEVEVRFAGADVPRPAYWSGFRVVPNRIEFWEEMPSRLHQRTVYLREPDGWRTETLFP